MQTRLLLMSLLGSVACAVGVKPGGDAGDWSLDNATSLESGVGDAEARVPDAPAFRRDAAAAWPDLPPVVTQPRPDAAAEASVDPPLVLSSRVLTDGETMPSEYRCTGPSPELTWVGGPASAQSYAVVFKEVTPAGSGALQWLIYSIPPTVRSLPEGVPMGPMPETPAGAKQGAIWNNEVGYNGPCAIGFGSRTYLFTLYALSVADVAGGNVQGALENAALAKATLMVTSP